MHSFVSIVLEILKYQERENFFNWRSFIFHSATYFYYFYPKA